jgi:hypothetical protein
MSRPIAAQSESKRSSTINDGSSGHRRSDSFAAKVQVSCSLD